MLTLVRLLALYFVATATLPSMAQLPVAPETEIDRYVQQEDSAYRWEILTTRESAGIKTVVVDMVSQRWLTTEQVDRPEWQHHLILSIPNKLVSDTGFLMISGGANGRDAPTEASLEVREIARATGTVVAELKMVPNQPLVFHGDGVRRTEDDLIGYTWAQYLKTGDASWLARNAMVKSAVRAMDTMTAVVAEVANEHVVSKFVVAGASKRGWTTWLTGAMDKRVVGIVPIVIDVLNTDPSMRHHFAAYGYWAPSIGNYVEHRIMEEFDNPRLQDLYRLVDPYSYRNRLVMPKLILNAVGDQFFLPDSSQYYWDALVGEKHLRYVPNTDHGMKQSDALETVIAFYTMLVKNQPRPQFTWEMNVDGAFVVTPMDAPREVRLWQATNPHARDFRLETFGAKFTSEPLTAQPDGTFLGNVAEPEQGWTAYFVELTYDVDAPVSLKLTTHVKVTPDTVPYADRDLAKPASVTLRCKFASTTAATAATNVAKEFFRTELGIADLQHEQHGTDCYFNWIPKDFEAEADRVLKCLRAEACQGVSIQLESGRTITVTNGP
ncbi:MAG: PhoPQ-activated pathogenicity-related family protein [Pirellulaceae bacterium]